MSTRTKAVTKDAQLEDPAAQGKRKRSTLADVTVNRPKARGLAAEKGKAKDDATQAVPVPPSKFAGVVIKNKSAATTAIPQSRQVLRSATAAAPHLPPPSKRTTRSSALPNHVVPGTKAEPKPTLHVDAMVIDPPDLHVPPTRVNGHARKFTSSVTAAQKTSAAHVKHEERERDDIEAEANRVFKKRRTSSEPPEDQEKRTVKNMLRQETRFATLQRGSYRNTSKTSGVSLKQTPMVLSWEKTWMLRMPMIP